MNGIGRGNLQADLGGEVAEFVHGQQVAGEAEDRRQRQQRHAAEPAEFARLAIGLHEEDREHVHEDGEDHQVGRPGVRRTDQPAEVHHEGDLADRLVCFGAGPVVDQQQDAGEALDEEEEERDAAPVVPEGLGVDGHSLVAREGRDLREAEALIDPTVDRVRERFSSHEAILNSEQRTVSCRCAETSTPASLTATLNSLSGLGGGPLTLAPVRGS